jgi:MYXO-CTERM domain-containing protein
MTKSNKAAMIAAALIFASATPAVAQDTVGPDGVTTTDVRDRDEDRTGLWGLLGLLGLAGLLGRKRQDTVYRDDRSTTGTTGSRH